MDERGRVFSRSEYQAMQGRRPSILDGLPHDAPLDMAALEAAMEADLEARSLAALDRVLANRTGSLTPQAALHRPRRERQ